MEIVPEAAFYTPETGSLTEVPSLHLYAVQGEAWIVEPGEKTQWVHEGVPMRMEADRGTPPLPPSVALRNPEGDRGKDYLSTVLTLEEAHSVVRQLRKNGLSGGATRRGGFPTRTGAEAKFTTLELCPLVLPLERNGDRIPAPLTTFGGERTEVIWDKEIGGIPMHIRGDWRRADTSFQEDPPEHPFG